MHSSDRLLLVGLTGCVSSSATMVIGHIVRSGPISSIQLLALFVISILLPLWIIMLFRALRYLIQRSTPSEGFGPGDRVWVRGKRAALKHRMLGLPLIEWDQPLFGFGADPSSWWALTDDGEWVTAHAPHIERISVLDQLSEI